MEELYWQAKEGLRCHGAALRHHDQSQINHSVICLPGLTRNEKDFYDLAQWLTSETFDLLPMNVYCPTFRGRGLSDYDSQWENYNPMTYVADIQAMMDQLDIGSAIFIGTSLGGIVTMLMAALQPNRVKAAVLNDIGPELASAGIERIAGYVGQPLAFSDWEEATLAVMAVHGEVFPDWDKQQWMKFIQQTYKYDESKGILPDYDQNISKAFQGVPPDLSVLWPAFQSMTCPTLSIRGELSDLFTEEIQHRMIENNASMHYAVIPQRGHAPMLSEPASRAAIEKFMKGL
ncbi:MAG: alpha/beta fold hydrolase [bacterium]